MTDLPELGKAKGKWLSPEDAKRAVLSLPGVNKTLELDELARQMRRPPNGNAVFEERKQQIMGSGHVPAPPVAERKRRPG